MTVKIFCLTINVQIALYRIKCHIFKTKYFVAFIIATSKEFNSNQIIVLLYRVMANMLDKWNVINKQTKLKNNKFKLQNKDIISDKIITFSNAKDVFIICV